MTQLDVVTAITGERLTTKNTVGAERPTRDEVARLAYDLYERRGGRHGQDVDDWLAAEQQLLRHYQ